MARKMRLDHNVFIHTQLSSKYEPAIGQWEFHDLKTGLGNGLCEFCTFFENGGKRQKTKSSILFANDWDNRKPELE